MSWVSEGLTPEEWVNLLTVVAPRLAPDREAQEKALRQRIASLEAELAAETRISAVRAEVIAAEKAWRVDDTFANASRFAARASKRASTASACTARKGRDAA